MFQTDVSSEVTLPAGLSFEGEKSWWYVKKRLHMYWFHVVCEITYEEDETYTEIFLIDQIDHLLKLNSTPDFHITEVTLVSPSYMNGDEHWKMEPLSEIQEGFVDASDTQTNVHLFILKDGRRYIDDKLSESDEATLVDTQTLFKLE